MILIKKHYKLLINVTHTVIVFLYCLSSQCRLTAEETNAIEREKNIDLQRQVNEKDETIEDISEFLDRICFDQGMQVEVCQYKNSYTSYKHCSSIEIISLKAS